MRHFVKTKLQKKFQNFNEIFDKNFGNFFEISAEIPDRTDVTVSKTTGLNWI